MQNVASPATSVTLADGVTVTTTNLLKYSAIPEPTTASTLWIGTLVFSWVVARRKHRLDNGGV
jgi:hypothetical protein